MIKQIIFHVPGMPVSVNKLYPGIQKRHISKAGKAYKEKVAFVAKAAMNQKGHDVFLNRVRVHIIYVFPDERRRDVTSFDKAILDAMNGIVYMDDSQIFSIALEKQVNVGKTFTQIAVKEE